ncbi:hypothetical protein GCM10010964_08910 [Caldovatus sediminis]|uniref:Uncharacterized protein n=1 Tax=Caldovatus sediminis TaxID=2041189 RepID=A0A8J3EA74_9PROT|nr:hypothetical protein GCM10010964_08910 [Caldovatus sediminis]
MEHPQRQRHVLLLQRLAPQEGERDALGAVVAVALQVVRGEADAGGVEAGAREAAGLDEGEDVGAVLAAEAQHHAGPGAFGLPVPVLAVQQRAVGARLGQDDGAGAALGRGAGGGGGLRRAAGELEHLGAAVDQDDVLEGDAGALGDAAHLGDVGGVEGLDPRHEGAGHGAHLRRVLAGRGELRAVVLEGAAHPRLRRLAVGAAAVLRGAGKLDQREGFEGHGGGLPPRHGRRRG